MTQKKTPRPPVLKSVLIHHLRLLAVELKRTPTTKDIVIAARQKKCPFPKTIRNAFGTITQALKAAKLPTRSHQEFTREQLIAQLQDLSRALGRPVTRRDVRKAGKAGICARLVTFARTFATPINAFREAGVSSFQRATRSDLISQYKALSKELGRIPTIEDIDRAAREGKVAGSSGMFRKLCGGVAQLRKDAGLFENQRSRYTRPQLLDQLKTLAKKLGRTPGCPDVNAACRNGDCASSSTFIAYFGSYNRAVREAGLEIARHATYSRAQLLHLLRELAKRLGRSPSNRDINSASRRRECASASAYKDYFGGLDAAFKAVGLERAPNKLPPRSPPKYTRSQLQEHLKTLAAKLGRRPTATDVAAASRRGECASLTSISKEFGTLTAALQATGFDLESRVMTRDALIKQLQELTRELGRIPSTTDITRVQGKPSRMSRSIRSTPATFKRFFGSAAEARKAAGLDEILEEMGIAPKYPAPRNKYDRDQLILHLCSLAKSLGRMPVVGDIRKASRDGRGPGLAQYARQFGGIPAAREAAKIEAVLRQVRKVRK